MTGYVVKPPMKWVGHVKDSASICLACFLMFACAFALLAIGLMSFRAIISEGNTVFGIIVLFACIVLFVCGVFAGVCIYREHRRREEGFVP